MAAIERADEDDTLNGGSKYIFVYVFVGIALYNVIELAVHITGTFKRFRGLYCWSCIASTLGIAFESVGFLLGSLRDKQDINLYAYCSMIWIGWPLMVGGQSLVLYSRLHIVLHYDRVLRFVLIMIIFNTICLGAPLLALFYFQNSHNPHPYLRPYAIFEKIQLTIIFVQEVLISALYIIETFRILRSQRGLTTGGSRRIMTHLILMNLVAIFVDASILGLEFAHHYDVQMAWKPLAYSIKLKMEFCVLNRLVELSQRVRAGRGLELIDTPPADAAGLPLGFMDDSTSVDPSSRDGTCFRPQARMGQRLKPNGLSASEFELA